MVVWFPTMLVLIKRSFMEDAGVIFDLEKNFS